MEGNFLNRQQYCPFDTKRISLTFYSFLNLSPLVFPCKIHRILLHYILRHFLMLLLCWHIPCNTIQAIRFTFAKTSFKLDIYASHVEAKGCIVQMHLNWLTHPSLNSISKSVSTLTSL